MFLLFIEQLKQCTVELETRIAEIINFMTSLWLFSEDEMKHSRSIVDLCDKPWNLWCDKKAPWKNDDLHLPGEFELKSLPVNLPTIGWERMYSKERIKDDVKEVSLPSTVEEHFWGKYSYHSYNQAEYFFAHNDLEVKNGVYQGVSWWWRRVFIPKSWEGKRLRIKFPGARLRAEVYFNEQLVGYNIITETPFEIDITDVAQYGKDNWLAVRITNPGGRLDWPDFSLPEIRVPSFFWGNYKLPWSHGFGGLDAGIKLACLRHGLSRTNILHRVMTLWTGELWVFSCLTTL